MSLTIGLIAFTQEPINQVDIFRYYSVFSEYAQMNVVKGILTVAKTNNIFFEFTNFLFSRFFPKTPEIISLFWVTVSYFLFLLGIHRYYYLKSNRKNNTFMLVFVLISLLGIIHFTTVVENLKQISAMAFLFYGIIKKLVYNKGGLFWVVLSFFTHFSSLLFIPIYFLINLKNKKVYYLYLFLVVSFLFGLFINFNAFLYNILQLIPGKSVFETRASSYINYSNWSIKFYNYIDFLMFSIISFSFLRKKINDHRIRNILVYVLSILALNLNNAHNFLRFLANLRFFFGLAFLEFLRSTNEKNLKYILFTFITLGYVTLNFIYIYNRVSPFTISGEVNVYRSIFLDGNILNLFKFNILNYFQ